jgi:uncharacterized membrane protein YtjA (UPF0391 family)
MVRCEALPIKELSVPTRVQNAAVFPTAEVRMLYYALIFLVVALIAGALGFGGVASVATSIAQVLFFVFLVLFLVTLITSLVRRGRPPSV